MSNEIARINSASIDSTHPLRNSVALASPGLRSSQAPITSAQAWRLDKKEYLAEQKIYRVYTCLLTALAVDRPNDARAYLKEKILELRMK